MKPADLVVTRWGARFMGRRFPCSIGKHGTTDRKREGDGKTPLGTHRIVGMLYRPDRLSPAELPDWALPFGPHDLILLTDWNWPQAVPGRGSAIFLHTWRRPRHGTAGCVAFALPDLLWIAGRIRHDTRLIIR